MMEEFIDIDKPISDQLINQSEELHFLRFFYSNIVHCLGPASGDCYDLVKEWFEEEHGQLPRGYNKTYGDAEE